MKRIHACVLEKKKNKSICLAEYSFPMFSMIVMSFFLLRCGSAFFFGSYANRNRKRKRNHSRKRGEGGRDSAKDVA